MERNINIVIADDNQNFLDCMEKILENVDEFKILGKAKDGEQAISLVKELKPDVFITDIDMPKYNGIDVIKRVKEYSVNIPNIYVVSGGINEKERMEVVRLGVRKIFNKPIDPKLIIEEIKNGYVSQEYVMMRNMYKIEDNNITDRNNTYAIPEETNSNVKKGNVIGKIIIPEIDMKSPIIKETTTEYLKIAPTKYCGPDVNEIRKFSYSRA